MVKRSGPRMVPPVFKLPIWKQDGPLWWAESSDILKAIEEHGASEEQIRGSMGYGYGKLADALDGKRLSRWDVQLIESGIVSWRQW